jgi:CheY-like chemotaxis protein/anti-sigma regulatory factor (Ser/Thr protein kinase)
MDKGKVRQIIVNILSNSVKFTPSQGTIEFTVEQDETDTGEIFTRFIIKDTGIGMSEDFISRAFEPFVSGTDAVDEEESAGLGLSIVKKLVDLMGGTVKLSSKKNVGTETRVELVFAKKDYDSLRSEETDSSSFDLAGKRILVAEDNAINQEMAVILLEKEGMIVETADNGLRAVEAVVDNPDEHGYDAILMDIEMPILDGIKAAKSIRSIGTDYAQNIPIIAMTANAFEHDIRKSLEAGMNGHISKPVAASELYRVLDREIKKNGEGRK